MHLLSCKVFYPPCIKFKIYNNFLASKLVAFSDRPLEGAMDAAKIIICFELLSTKVIQNFFTLYFFLMKNLISAFCPAIFACFNFNFIGAARVDI